MTRSLIAASSVLALLWAAGPAMSQEATSLRVGATVNGALDSSDPVTAGSSGHRYEDFRFTGRAGSRIEATLRSDDFDAYLELRAEGNDDVLTENDDGVDGETTARLRYTLPANGTYMLRARTYSGRSGGDYSLSLREMPAVRAPRPTAIRLGRSVEGELTVRDPLNHVDRHYDAYSYRGQRGERIVIDLRSSDFDPVLHFGQMMNGRFVELAQNDDAPSGGLDSRIVYTLPESGEYIIQAATLGTGLGDYELEVSEAAPLVPGTPIGFDDEVSGTLKSDSPLSADGVSSELYSFTATAGQRVSISLRSSEFDAYLTLRRDADSQSVATDDDGLGSGTDSRIVYTAEEAGDYTIEVRSFGSSGGTGRFRLKLEELPPPPAPKSLAFSTVVEDRISPEGAVDNAGRPYTAYRFEGAAGERVRAIMRSGDFDSYLELGRAGDNFEALASDDDGLGEGVDSRLDFILPTTGTYELRALPLSGKDGGVYSIELLQRGPEPKPGSLMVGSSAQGTLGDLDAQNESGIYFDDYLFQAKAGDKLRLTMVSNDFDALIEVAHEGDSFLALETDDDSLSDRNAKLDWTVPDDGTYVLRARSYGNNQTGRYVVEITHQP